MAGDRGQGALLLVIALAGATVAAASTARAASTADPSATSRTGHLSIKIGHRSAEAATVAVQPDNAIVAAGTASNRKSSRFALARCLPSGKLDPSFGNRGRVTTDFGAPSGALALGLQEDGRILAAGFVRGAATANQNDFLIARYLPDGRLDPEFGSAGKVKVDFGGDDYATSLDIQADGKIVVAGGVDRGNPAAQDPDSRLAVARLNSDGSLDSGFASSGKASVSLGGFNAGLALTTLPDESISIAGVHTPNPFAPAQDSLAIARYSSTGSLDPGFGNGGTLTRDLTMRRAGGRVRDVQPYLGAVAFTTDGSVVATTQVAIYTRRKLIYETWIARFAPDGSPQPGFGTGGYASLKERVLFLPLVASPEGDGSLYLAGFRFARRSPMVLVHLDVMGSLDRQFGQRGRARVPFRGANSQPSASATDAAGRVVLAGTVAGKLSPRTGRPLKPARMALARYTSEGVLDPTFGAHRGHHHRH